MFLTYTYINFYMTHVNKRLINIVSYFYFWIINFTKDHLPHWVGLLALSPVDCGVKPKNIKLGFASFPLSTQYKEASSKTGWLRIWIVFEWSQLSTRGMLFQWASTIKKSWTGWSSKKQTSPSIISLKCKLSMMFFWS